ncbi:hypothetical protein P691DRAFT_668039 [Macrolepiota fuliginosa MF-IS2]|uniref:F-box domain-containing protein n=1 Tax=Macrolepiota fuliginosa MF-IS2 TaxID=1400762 RepID=A0A9P5XH66_9AGAR|nr:hypothetical protein P691DRAFT_668039 [Macrolepiota fuliginosa MF-IS2]
MGYSTSTIHCLPVELLTHIFALATHGEEDSSFSQYSRYRPAFDTASVKVPVAVSCVSRHWRHVALSAPALWTSLCITQEMIMDDCYGQSYLDTSFLNIFLARSQMYPLDILIDARDPSWSFTTCEPDTPFHCESDVYSPPFSGHHMLGVMSFLLPYIHRWRSLEILTDVWAPMFVALDRINPFLMTHGAPRLESLTLSRCNEYASYSPDFYPKTMRGKHLFSIDEHTATPQKLGDLLPSLRHLKLQGVHVEWSVLGQILSQRTNASLASLELDYHCRDVRPSPEEFHQILASSRQLEALTISGSGPLVTDLDDDATLVHYDCPPVSLPKLQNLTLGYRDVFECQTVLEMLNAPDTRVFTLEDATHVADPEEVDAGPILAYLGTGNFCEFEQKGDSTRAMFPSLTSLSLSSVQTRKRPLNAFLNSLQHLQHLSLSNMDLEEAIPALVPSSLNTANDSIICPCPRLEHLSLKNVDPDRAPHCQRVIAFVNNSRRDSGAVPLKHLDVYALELEDEDGEMDLDGEGEFCPGGAFNDPEFDRSYVSVLQYR